MNRFTSKNASYLYLFNIGILNFQSYIFRNKIACSYIYFTGFRVYHIVCGKSVGASFAQSFNFFLAVNKIFNLYAVCGAAVCFSHYDILAYVNKSSCQIS